MDAEVVVPAVAIAVSLGYYAAIGVFGIWAYRNAQMGSGLWLSTWLVVDLVVGFAIPTFWSRLTDHLVQGNLLQTMLVGQFLILWHYVAGLSRGIAVLALGLMVLADIIHLASMAGIDTSQRSVAWLGWAHTRQTTLGVIAFLFAGVTAMIPLALYYYYS